MDAKRFGIGTLIGGVTILFVGYLLFELLPIGDFYAANVGSATGVMRSENVLWAVALGCLSYAALVTLAIGRQGGSASIGAGAQIGAIVGFLVWFTANFIFYGITNVYNLTKTIIDPLAEAVRGGIGGAVIAAALRTFASSGVRGKART
jgi:hypothetical protein